MLNVDLARNGGIGRRDTVSVLNTTACDFIPNAMWMFGDGAGVYQVMIQNGGRFSYQNIASGPSGAFTAVYTDGLGCTGRMRAATFKNLCFIQRNAERAVLKWTGSAVTTLGTAFNDDFTNPLNANMPKAKCIASWGGYLWVANTVESGTAFKSRIRFSHPNNPMDFRTNDYIDVDIGHDGDEITALVPFHDRLLIFKAGSVHVIYGYDFTSFSEQLVSAEAGAISQEAVAATDMSVYFFSNPDGVYEYSASGVQWAFNRIAPLIVQGHITLSQSQHITLGWLNRRLWVSVPVGQGAFTLPATGGSANNTVFVLDPQLARHRRYMTAAQRAAAEGGWVRYDLALGPFLLAAVPNAVPLFLAASANEERVISLHTSMTAATDTTYSTGVAPRGSVGTATPDSAGLDILGDITIIVRGRIAWNASYVQTLVAKWNSTSNQRSYALSVNATGFPVLEWSADGTTVLSATSAVAVPVANGTGVWIRASLDVVNGGNRVIKFEFSDDGVDYTRYSVSTATTAGNTSIFSSTAEVTVGYRDQVPQQFVRVGDDIQRVVISSGLPAAQAQKANPDFTSQLAGVTSFADAAGNTWTTTAELPGRSGIISSYYTTRWFDLDEPARKKRWRRPEFALSSTDTGRNFSVDVFRDYNTAAPYRTLTFTTPSIATGGEAINKLGTLGLARAIRLTLTNTATKGDWSLDAVTLKYIPRRIVS